MRTLIALALLALVPLHTRADTIDLGTHGALNLAVPKGWKATTSTQADVGLTIQLTPPDSVNAQGLITLVYVPKGEVTSKGDVDEKVLLAGDNYVDQSLEKKKTLRSFNMGNGAYGSYCFFTDALLVGHAPAKGNFKAVASGIVWFNADLSAVVSLLTDDEKGPDFAAMLSAVSSARLVSK